MLEFVIGKNGSIRLNNGIPKLLVMLFQDDDQACGLRIESARDMLDGVSDELFDTSVGDGGFIGELVERAALFRHLEKSL